MKTILLITLFSLFCSNINAQDNATACDSTVFIGEYYNDEYKVFIKINFVDKDILVPGQEILGELDGFFGSTQSSHIWAITSSDIKGDTAQIEVINNYGSEDFTATIIIKNDGTLEFKHLSGSTFKFPVNKKWQKLPSKLLFIKKQSI